MKANHKGNTRRIAVPDGIKIVKLAHIRMDFGENFLFNAFHLFTSASNQWFAKMMMDRTGHFRACDNLEYVKYGYGNKCEYVNHEKT